jgi:hypothetical protein
MNSPEADRSSANRVPLAMLGGAGVVLLLIAVAYFLGRGSGGSSGSQPAHLPFGAAEQAYAGQIHFSDLQMSQATNLLNQEFTYLVGTVENSGGRAVQNSEVTVEFHDLINQVVLRETVRVLPPGSTALGAGHKRDFQLTFEAVPASWNRKAPAMRVTGLEFQ